MAAIGAIPVIDIFAGPGGLSEGFSAARFRGRRSFQIALSIEKDPDAHATLMLRSFFRQFAGRQRSRTVQHVRDRCTR
jgi:site-specific DNA-cytosine methylase